MQLGGVQEVVGGARGGGGCKRWWGGARGGGGVGCKRWGRRENEEIPLLL